MLITQSAWAFHSSECNDHPENVNIQSSEINYEMADSHSHCGHANIHLVGIISGVSNDFTNAAKVIPTTEKHLLASIGYQPPIPPPIS